MFKTQLAASVLVGSLFAGAASAVPITETFESLSQGSLTNGTVINDLVVADPGAGAISVGTSPFTAGGSNAFHFNGEPSGVATIASVPVIGGDNVQIGFSLSVSQASTAGNGSRFLSVFATLPDDSLVEIIRLHHKKNAGNTQTWLVANNGAGNVASNADGLFMLLNKAHRVEIAINLVAGTYDVSLTAEDSSVVISYTALALMAGGTTNVQGFVIGDLVGSNMDGIVDNINVVPEPSIASAAMAGLALSLIARRRPS